MRRLLPLLLPLLLGGCRFSSTWVKTHDRTRLPFDLKGVKHALWADYGFADPDRGEGLGMLALTAKEASCGDLDALAGYYALYTDGPADVFGDEPGVFAFFGWWSSEDRDEGYEGTYVLGGYAYSDDYDIERYMVLAPYAEDQLWLSYESVGGIGQIEGVSSSEVTGRIDSDLLDARFKAENCGRIEVDYTNDTSTYYSSSTSGSRR